MNGVQDREQQMEGIEMNGEGGSNEPRETNETKLVGG
jgi:hypothetical protein